MMKRINIIDLVANEKFWVAYPEPKGYPIMSYGDIEKVIKFKATREELIDLIMEKGVPRDISVKLVAKCVTTGLQDATYCDYTFEYPTEDMLKGFNPSRYAEIRNNSMSCVGKCMCGHSVVGSGSRPGDICPICGTMVFLNYGIMGEDGTPLILETEMRSKRDHHATDILSNEKWTDDIKLSDVFDLYKVDLKKQFPNLYYALLAWKDSHHKELMREKSKRELTNNGTED